MDGSSNKSSKKNKSQNGVKQEIKQEAKKEVKREAKEETIEEKVVFKNTTTSNKNVVSKKEENNEKNQIPKQELKKPEKKVKVETAEEAKAEILENKDNQKRKIGAILIILTVILVAILNFSTLFAMVHSTKNTIANGVKINNIDISGLTKDEAKSKLNEAFKTILDVDINLIYKDYNYKIKSEDIEFAYNFQKELDEAYSIGRNGNILKCNYSLISTAFLKKNIEFTYKYNENILNAIIDKVSTEIPGLVTDYSYYIEDENLIINPGKDGIKVEKEKLKQLIESSLNNRNPVEIIKNFKNEEIKIPIKQVETEEIDIDKIYGEVYAEPQNAYFTPATDTEKANIYADIDGVDFAISIDEAKEKLKEEANEYVIPINRKKAEITINDIGLEAFPNKLQEFSTRYDASNWGRSENLRIATSKINNTVLMPGGQFSFNGVVGERTVQEGYKNAAIYEGDAVVSGLAGGICQVSSTLYNAVLLANLQIDERYNHSFKTSYVDAGRDATVVYGIKDLKFTNTRSYPIKIEGSAENGVITFSIYGIEEDTEYKINILPVITSTTPYTVQTITDYTMQPGTQYVSQVGSSGCMVTTYKEIVLNGTVISKDAISNDIYKPMNRIIKVGPTLSIQEESLNSDVSTENSGAQ